MKIILASASPRRRELLERAGVAFDVLAVDALEETDSAIKPDALVVLNAERKAMAARSLLSGDDIILAADTLVYINGNVLGKPTNERCAREMLKELSGARHEVYTGVCIIVPENGVLSFVERTNVFMRYLSAEAIERYIQTGEPMDKAGAYGIQGVGSMFIKRIEGDYYNVVGLPLCRLCAELEKIGVNVF